MRCSKSKGSYYKADNAEKVMKVLDKLFEMEQGKKDDFVTLFVPASRVLRLETARAIAYGGLNFIVDKLDPTGVYAHARDRLSVGLINNAGYYGVVFTLYPASDRMDFNATAELPEALRRSVKRSERTIDKLLDKEAKLTPSVDFFVHVDEFVTNAEPGARAVLTAPDLPNLKEMIDNMMPEDFRWALGTDNVITIERLKTE